MGDGRHEEDTKIQRYNNYNCEDSDVCIPKYSRHVNLDAGYAVHHRTSTRLQQQKQQKYARCTRHGYRRQVWQTKKGERGGKPISSTNENEDGGRFEGANAGAKETAETAENAENAQETDTMHTQMHTETREKDSS